MVGFLFKREVRLNTCVPVVKYRFNRNVFFQFAPILVTLLTILRVTDAQIIKAELPLYIYSDHGEIGKYHFYPVGRMGEKSDIRLIENYRHKPYEGKTCIVVLYLPRVLKTWSGMYWLHPANNWGKLKDQGYDLRGAKKFVFYAKGKVGGEHLNFKVGGLRSRHGDTTTAQLNAIKLTKEWKRYEINLEESDLSRIIGGFCFNLNSDDNSKGATFYLDELRYE